MSLKPREKLIQQGATALLDEELVAIFLRTGRRGTPVIELAREILAEAGGIRGILEMESQAIQKIPGLGPAKTTQLMAIREMARRYLKAQIPPKEVIHSSQALYEYLKISLRGLREEILSVIFLSGRNEILSVHELANTREPNSASFPIRDLMKRGLASGASAFLLAHNHPSGESAPSQDDIQTTRLCFFAGRFLGILLYEHLIIGENDFFSFSQAGLIRKFEQEFGDIKKIHLTI